MVPILRSLCFRYLAYKTGGSKTMHKRSKLFHYNLIRRQLTSTTFALSLINILNQHMLQYQGWQAACRLALLQILPRRNNHKCIRIYTNMKNNHKWNPLTSKYLVAKPRYSMACVTQVCEQHNQGPPFPPVILVSVQQNAIYHPSLAFYNFVVHH
jgi:hypothetical protein